MSFAYKSALVIAMFVAACSYAETNTTDPLAVEIAKWKKYIVTNPSTDEDWKGLRGVAEPVLTKAEKALERDYRVYALHMLGLVRYMLAGDRFLASYGAKKDEMKVLEAEWSKSGSTFGAALRGKSLPSFDRVNAAVRAIGEASYSEVQPYYEASIEYGRNTVASAGLYYIGTAQAQLEFARFCASLAGDRSSEKPPRLPGLDNQIDKLEDELLQAYKPPASIDSHPLFIRISAILKGAREMQKAGLNYGAMYRMLDGRVRFNRLKSAGNGITADEASTQAAAARKKLQSIPGDHTIAQLFIQMALIEAEDVSEGSKGGEAARAIFQDVLPRYFAALEPGPAEAEPASQATVTLVRWPYT